MATSKTTTKAPKVTPFPAENISESYHADYNQVLTVTTIMTKPTKGRASFEFEIHLNGDLLGIYPDRATAERELRAAAMAEIEKIQAYRALVELEAANGVPEAIAELTPITPTRTIEYNRVTGKFDLYMVGGSTALTSKDTYLEAETYARNHFGEPALPF